MPRRYTRQQRTNAVIAAEMTSLTAVHEASGIPKQTLSDWMRDTDGIQLRTKTREEMAADALTLAHLAYRALTKKIIAGEMEGRDLVTAYGVAIDKGQLLSGAATERTEHRELLADFDDHEREAMSDWLLDVARARLVGDVPAN
jgi:hypothetical protein